MTIKVLFVCMGNICRSPTAEGVFKKTITKRNVAQNFIVASAGTHAYHIGDAPDHRAQQAAFARGVDLSQQRARKFIRGDFEDFDYILAMDHENFKILTSACPAEFRHKIHYFLDFAPELTTREVPDPYYGGPFGFEEVLDLVETASGAFLAELINQKGL
ncbi:MAG: low molecular weight protein-tyrosine-phosphatase [Methylococcales bacterium]|jgi:protein-tyrosine phosphatase